MAAGENQGYLGKLDEKTLPELRELLQRQQSIMSKLQFVAKLPDKGEKIKAFIQKLTQLINQRMEGESDPSRLNNITFYSEPIAYVNPSAFESLRDKSVHAPYKISDDSSVQQTGTMMDVAEDLSKGFERIAVSSEKDAKKENDSKLTDTYINSYDRVITRADKRIKRPVFKPNSTLKISNIDELPDKFKYKSRFKQQQDKLKQTETSTADISDKPTNFLSSQNKDNVSMDTNSSDASQVNSRVTVKSNVREESAVCLPHYQFNSAKMISIEESIKLVDEQRKKQEEIQTKQAADRLTARLHIKMDNYNPEGTNMKYRVNEASDTDSDDEPEQAGYESGGSV